MATWTELKEEMIRDDPAFGKELTEIEELVDISYILRHQREDLGLTQEELASRCNISLKTVQKMEYAEKMPNLRIFIRVLHELGLNLNIG